MNCISTHKTTGICFQKSTKDVFPAAKNITDATRSNVRLQAGIHIWCSSCLNNNDSPKKWGKQNSQAQSLKYTFLQWSLVKTTPPDKILDLKHSSPFNRLFSGFLLSLICQILKVRHQWHKHKHKHLYRNIQPLIGCVWLRCPVRWSLAVIHASSPAALQ